MTVSIDTDLVTPLAAYLRLRAGARAAFLLESVDQGRLGRHSFVGCGDRLVTFEEAEQADGPVVGYLGYDHVARLEPTVPLPADGPDVPESRFVVADVFMRFDHVTGTADVLHGDPAAVAEALAGAPSLDPEQEQVPAETVRAPDRAEHERRVRAAQELIRRGDAFQIVLSQRAERPTIASPLAVYRALRRINPSPYLFLLELGDLALVGSSPETHVKVEDGRASLNPIAGTTERGDGDAERLLSSEKDRAEHVMLVDLGRNDLSRVCRAGTVKVERFLEPERFSHVTHLVSEVAGELRPGVTPFDVLASHVSGRDGLRRAQGARDADHLGARGLPSRHVRRRGRIPRARARARHVHRNPHRTAP